MKSTIKELMSLLIHRFPMREEPAVIRVITTSDRDKVFRKRIQNGLKDSDFRNHSNSYRY
jgi:hypothetical protein